MKEIWSKNKYINTTVNILIFLMAINFMHYGQFFLPVICLILFIDNKFKFRINNWFLFIVLCLFAITFFMFSYELGFYGVIGFCLPMAYYIGSNVYEPTEDKTKNIIYLIAFGMASHLVLNFIFELFLWDFNISLIFSKVSHYDIWVYLLNTDISTETSEFLTLRVKTTGTSINYVFILSCIFYLVQNEKNRKIKLTGILLFILSTIYIFALGRRTMLALIVVTLIINIILYLKNNTKLNRKRAFYIIVFSVLSFVTICLIILAMIEDENSLLANTMLIKKIKIYGIKSDRIKILLESIKLYPYHLFGKQEISSITGSPIHDLWGDVYDYAGVIPYILIIFFSAYTLKSLFKITKKDYSKNNILLICWFICSSIILFVEPVITGSSLYLICVILVNSLLISVN